LSQRPFGVLAAFRHVDAAARAIRQVKELGYQDFTVYSPVPNFEIMQAVGHTVSPVRVWTLVGGMTGCLSGYAMTMWMSYDYPIVVGGKALGSVPPYIIIMFELTVLLGALFTIAGLIFHAIKNHRAAAYDPRFTNDLIGIFVPCPPERRAAVEQVLKQAGATEVQVEA
jgi:molybdopterin-containing oxidoreductase family membrane subunit